MGLAKKVRGRIEDDKPQLHRRAVCRRAPWAAADVASSATAAPWTTAAMRTASWT
jgi:hypothetical protein